MAYPCRIRQSQTGHISHYSYSLVSVSQSQLPFFLLANSSRRMTCPLHARVWWDVIRPKLLHELAVRVRALSGKCQNRYWISQSRGSFPF